MARVASPGIVMREWTARCQASTPGTMYRAPTKKRQRRDERVARCQACVARAQHVAPLRLLESLVTHFVVLLARRSDGSIRTQQKGKQPPVDWRSFLLGSSSHDRYAHRRSRIASGGLLSCARFSFLRDRRRTGSHFRTGMTRSARASVAARSRERDRAAR